MLIAVARRHRYEQSTRVSQLLQQPSATRLVFIVREVEKYIVNAFHNNDVSFTRVKELMDTEDPGH